MELPVCTWNSSAANGLYEFGGPSLKSMSSSRFEFPRQTLLVEIERYCSFPDCGWRNRVGLTKTEAIGYRGFDCSKCERWNDDSVEAAELPETWSTEILLGSNTSTAN